MGIALLSRRTTATFRQVGWAALSAFALGCGASAVGARDVPDASVLDAVDAAPRVTGDAARDSVAPSSDGSVAMNPHKPVQRGLIDMGVLGLDGRPASSPDDVKNYPGSFAGIVLNVTWAQLQPNGPDPLVDGDPLDVELDAVRAYDKANPKTPLSVKLRVAASFDAPAWAQRLSSGPVTIPPDPSDAKWRSGPVGEWWTPAYQAAWRDFQGLLAAKYDDDPLVYEVAVTSCSFQTDEPFIIPTGVALPVLHGIAAPYTYNDTAEKACLTSAREDYSAWKNTWVDFTFAYFAETDNGYVEDPAFTTATMMGCTEATNCILASHGLADTTPSTSNADIYSQFLTQKSSLVNLQTYAPNPGNWCGIITVAEKYHCASLELWPDFGGFTTLPPDVVKNLATSFANGAAPDPARCTADAG